MSRRLGPALGILGAALAILPSKAAPGNMAPAGALACAGCHAIEGPVPSLVGRRLEDIMAEMQAFRTGARPATVMDRIAKGFSDEETRAIATWLATNNGSAKP
jgi:cytochrome c553